MQLLISPLCKVLHHNHFQISISVKLILWFTPFTATPDSYHVSGAHITARFHACDFRSVTWVPCWHPHVTFCSSCFTVKSTLYFMHMYVYSPLIVQVRATEKLMQAFFPHVEASQIKVFRFRKCTAVFNFLIIYMWILKTCRIHNETNLQGQARFIVCKRLIYVDVRNSYSITIHFSTISPVRLLNPSYTCDSPPFSISSRITYSSSSLLVAACVEMKAEDHIHSLYM